MGGMNLNRRRLMSGGAGLLGAGVLAGPAAAVTESDLFPVAQTSTAGPRGVGGTLVIYHGCGLQSRQPVVHCPRSGDDSRGEMRP